MNKIEGLLLAGLLLGFVSNSSMAHAGTAYATTDFGRTKVADWCSGLPAGASCSPKTTSVRIGLGYQVNNNIGLETAYLSGGEISSSVTDTNNNNATTNRYSSSAGFQISAIGSIPLGSYVDIVGKAGLARLKAEASDTTGGSVAATSLNNTKATYGIGVRFKIKDKIAIRLMLENVGKVKASSTDVGSKITVLSAGLQLGF